MGYIKHWYRGTEYYLDEFCIRTDKQGSGAGTFFIRQIEKAIKAIGLKQIFLQTDVSAMQMRRHTVFIKSWALRNWKGMYLLQRKFEVKNEVRS